VRRALILLVIFFCGCFAPINNIGHFLPETQRLNRHKTVDRIKRHYFTPEAYMAIKDIPTINGIAYTPWVSGVNIWTNILGILSLSGTGRQVIVSSDSLTVSTFIHEYIHHLDDMDRDGDGEWIDHDEFAAAYKAMANDVSCVPIADNKYMMVYNYADIIKEIELKANYWVTDVFGIGPLSEHIAYMGHMLLNNGGPEYMWRVYRRILKRGNR